MSIRDTLRLRAHGEKRVIFLQFTPQAVELGKGDQGWQRQSKLIGTFKHDELLPLVKKALTMAKDEDYKLEPYSFFIPNVSNGSPLSADQVAKSLKAGKVLTCTLGKWQKPKLVLGDPEFKPKARKSSVIEDIDY